MALLPIYPMQVYGKHRSSTNIKERWLAHCLEVMLLRNKELHVAFIDAIPNKGGSASVMVKGAAQAGATALAPNTRVQEMYRIRLPHNPYTDRGVVIGEGKPENQNHACIFAFGEAMQAVDMNQDGCLAEAFKMRNLLTVGGQTGAGAKGVEWAEWDAEAAAPAWRCFDHSSGLPASFFRAAVISSDSIC